MIKDGFESFIYCVPAVVACVILCAVLVLIKRMFINYMKRR